MNPPRPAPAALTALVLAASIGLAAAQTGAPAATLSLGLSVATPEVPAALPPGDLEHPLHVRVAADWSSIETTAGAYDWSGLAAVLSTLRDRHARVTLCVRGDNALYPAGDRRGEAPDAAWLTAWTAFVRSAVKTLGPSIATIELGEHPERDWGPNVYAFVLKSGALAARAEAKSAGISLEVAQGVVGSDALAWEQDLLAADAAAYIDALPVALGDGDPAPVLASFLGAIVEHPPAPELRAYAAGSTDPWGPFATAVRSLGAGAAVALAELPADAEARDAFVKAVSGLAARLADGFAPAPIGRLALSAPDGGSVPGGALVGRFLHAKDFATLVVYIAPKTGDPEAQARLVLDTADVKDPAVVDLPSGAEYKTGLTAVPGQTRRALCLLLADHPMAAAWERVSENLQGLEVAPEDVLVKTVRGLTAQEIIARNQQVQKMQDDRLLRWTADGRVDIHAKLAQGGGSVDVGIESTYFWRRGGPLEWEQKSYFFNGNRVKWKKFPELPLIQPEKVATLPLDLTFDKTYVYRLVGEDTVAGRAAYILAFEPAADLAGKSLYRGRVWIDRETFVRLRTSVVQTNLEAPVLQNEETDTYVQVPGPDGSAVTLIGRVDGQQLWSAAGRNFVIRREYVFGNFAINPPEDAFDAELKDAYASNDQMLRDTERGFRYLEKRPDGGREVKDALKTTSLLGGAGAFKDSSISGAVPLIGINWFDWDVFKKKMQLNVFFAGVYAYVNFTNPRIGGTQTDLGVEASLVGLKLDDKFFVNGTEDVSQRVRRRSQYLTGRFGHPLGAFFKVTLIGDLTWNRYSESSDASDALAAQNAQNGTNLTFVLPSDHEVYAGTLQLEFNREGYSVTGAGTYSRRTAWDRWGLYDPAAAQYLDTTFDPGQQSFTTWRLAAFKEWYLPKFQKLKFELDYLDGANLDRFSQYAFSTFGDTSLEGFAGTGARFSTGTIARGGYAFNIVNVIRFDLSVETARVRDPLTDGVFQRHTGAGISFNVVGPWKTIWQGSYGRALWSDIPPLVGKQEFQFLVFKLF